MSADTKAAAKKASKARLRQELTELNKNPVQGFSAGLIDDDLYNWEVMIIGPPGTLYEGGLFRATLTFPEEYPMLPPKMRFTTPMWHPNIYEKGEDKGVVCISILHPPEKDQFEYESTAERWSPVHTVETIILSVISLLSTYPPNTDSPANVDAARDVNNELQVYRRKVKRMAEATLEG